MSVMQVLVVQPLLVVVCAVSGRQEQRDPGSLQHGGLCGTATAPRLVAYAWASQPRATGAPAVLHRAWSAPFCVYASYQLALVVQGVDVVAAPYKLAADKHAWHGAAARQLQQVVLDGCHVVLILVDLRTRLHG